MIRPNLQITLLQDVHVMQFMAGDSERKRPDGNFIVVGRAAPVPGIIRKVFEEEHCGVADRLVFLDNAAQSDAGEAGIGSETVLIEAW